MKSEKIGVMHLVDSLAAGGTEHVAIKLVNKLPLDLYRPYLCASRQTGPLQREIQSHVTFYDMHRKSRFDFLAIIKLAEFIRREHIDLIHAHSSSLFLGTMLCLFNPQIRLVWHDHFGLQGIKSRPTHLYLPFARRAHAVFSVTRELAAWSVQSLGLPQERIFYLPNFIEAQQPSVMTLKLPGLPGKRMVCVANIRAQKDHLTLLKALVQVIKFEPQAHLLLVGAKTDPYLAEQVWQESQRLGLASNLTFLGPREDVPLILANCDIGILGSVSEGFPVVLLEYGMAGLAVVATKVGECAEILEDGKAGLLVPPSDPGAMAEAILQLFQFPALRTQLGQRLAERVKQNYSVEITLKQVCQVYETIL